MQPHVESVKLAIVGNQWFPDHPGGLDRYVYELAHTLASDKTKIDLFGVGLPQIPPDDAITLINLSHSDHGLRKRLWSAYRTFNDRPLTHSNAINIHFALYGCALLPHLPAHVPVTCTFHGPWAQESAREGVSSLNVWLKKQIEQVVYNRCDRFIVLSKAFGNLLHQTYRISWDKIHVIPGGVDVQRFQANLSRREARSQLNWPQDRFILFTPRRLVQRMGLDKLLAALAQRKPAISDIWLAIAGKGPLRETLEQQVHDLGLIDHVKFLGFLPDDQLPIAYQAADLTVMPSQSLEGFGLVLLESLACGTPTLCTPVGGMPEVITGFSPELITATTDVTAIAQSLADIITQKISLPDRYSCREYASTYFNWHNIAQQVQAVLLK
jgi:glycosyltransferase involved in cell wall biosynthesis